MLDHIASNRTQEKVERLAQATGIRPASNRVVAELSDVIFICVRPLEVRDVLSDISHLLNSDKLVVSVAGDVTLEKLQALCPARVARAFPSMASQKLQGVTLLAFRDRAATEDRRLIADLFHAIGHAETAEEKDFAVLAYLTSCAPGYFAGLISSVATVGGITEAGGRSSGARRRACSTSSSRQQKPGTIR
ncbi:MAG TPA: NAD(P)-binding domain-containing protein [Methanothrix sp.]|nr:NAD(P)-binding domain-containing protein [Methanothrix sp.]